MAALVEQRICTKCNECKPVNEFYLNCYGRNGACNACVKAKNKAYYEQKKADISAKHAERRVAHVPMDKGAVERRREQDFAERYAQRRVNVNENKRERHQNDPQFRAVEAYDGKLYRAICNQSNDLLELVGCSPKFFREWIEYQFKPGMTWDNYGDEWSYDHTIPKSSFNFLDPAQAKECNHWSNIRPLNRLKNSQKRMVRDLVVENDQKMTSYLFEIIQDMVPRGNNARD